MDALHSQSPEEVLRGFVAADVMTHHAKIYLPRPHRPQTPAEPVTVTVADVDAVLDRVQRSAVSFRELPAWAAYVIELAHAGHLAFTDHHADLIEYTLEALTTDAGQRRWVDDPDIAALRQRLGREYTPAGPKPIRSPQLESRAERLLERRAKPHPEKDFETARVLWQSDEPHFVVTVARSHLHVVLDELAADPHGAEPAAQIWARSVRALCTDDDGRHGVIAPEPGYTWSIRTILGHLAAPAHLRAEPVDIAGIGHLRRLLEYRDPGHHHDWTEEDRDRAHELFCFTPGSDDDW